MRKNKKSYDRLHSWLHRYYGEASKCEGKDCRKISKNYDWAKIKGKKYAYKIENFFQLCRSCHARYDWNKEKLGNLLRGNKNLAKKYCLRGHKFDRKNTYWMGPEKRNRSCKKCRALLQREFMKRKKLKASITSNKEKK